MKVLDAARHGTRLVAAKLTGQAVPFHVVVYPTMRCNLRCVYCSSPYDPSEEMTAGEWCAAFDGLKEAGTVRLSFLGGEPLVRKDLDVIIAHARRCGFACSLTTNGTLVPRRPEVVKQLQTLVVSLDGPREAHERQRGEGNFDEAIHAIEAARAWRVPAKVNAVVSAENAGTLDWLLDFCRRERLPLSINLMRSDDTGLWHDAAKHRLSDERVRDVVDQILEAKKTNPWILFSNSTYRNARQWNDFRRDRLTVAEAGEHFPGPPCSAGRFHASIHSDGRLYPCRLTMKQIPALNVRTDGVAAALEAARDHGCATCYSPCMVEHNALFALQPSVVASLAGVYLRRSIE
jgi:MoaA/NifB/PqqE/SkfB family radical SAM enzyme